MKLDVYTRAMLTVLAVLAVYTLAVQVAVEVVTHGG